MIDNPRTGSNPQGKSHPQPRSITRRLLLHIVGWSVLVMLLLSVLLFNYAYDSARKTLIASLSEQQAQATALPERFLRRVETYGDILADRFVERYQASAESSGWSERFDRWYKQTSPGVLRLDRAFFAGTERDGVSYRGLSTFMGPRADHREDIHKDLSQGSGEGLHKGPSAKPISDELKRRVIVAQTVLAELGPAWSHEVTNSHVTMPENVLIMYDIQNPWGLMADADLVITDYGTVRATLQHNNPSREPLWTGLYFDLSAGFWTVTYQKPVDLDGQHLINASFDVSLQAILNALLATNPSSETTHLIIDDKGGVVATSLALSEELTNSGFLELSDLPAEFSNIPTLQQLSKAEISRSTAQLVREEGGQLLLARHLPRPGWWYISVLPESAITAAALTLPLQILAAGLLILIATLLVVYWQITLHVSRPLTWIARAAAKMSSADYGDLLRDDARSRGLRGEVALVFHAIQTAARRLQREQRHLEQEIEARTHELAADKHKLANHGDIDLVTGLLTRAVFDHDLHTVLAEGQDHSVWLCIGDLDNLKLYRAKQGDEAADDARRQICAVLNARLPGGVYRYSEREIAMLIPAESGVDGAEILAPLCKAVADLELSISGSPRPGTSLTLSVGATQLKPNDSEEASINRADARFFEAKSAGGNGFSCDEVS